MIIIELGHGQMPSLIGEAIYPLRQLQVVSASGCSDVKAGMGWVCGVTGPRTLVTLGSGPYELPTPTQN